MAGRAAHVRARGFIPSPVRADAASPICAPGFSLLLAPFRWIGGPDGIFVATPLAGALLVWFTFVVRPPARRAARRRSPRRCRRRRCPVLLFQVGAADERRRRRRRCGWPSSRRRSTREPTRPWLLGLLHGPRRARAAQSRARGGRRRRLADWSSSARPALALRERLLRRNRARVRAGGCRRSRSSWSLEHRALRQPLRIRLRPRRRSVRARQRAAERCGTTARAARDAARVPAARVCRAARPAARARRAVPGWRSAVSAVDRRRLPAVSTVREWWYLRFLLPALVPLTVLAIAAVVVRAARLPARAGGAAARRRVAVVIGARAGLACRPRASGRRSICSDSNVAFAAPARSCATGCRPMPSLITRVGERHGAISCRSRGGAVGLARPGVARSGHRVARGARARAVHRRRAMGRAAVPRSDSRAARRSAQLDWPPRFDIDRQVRIYRPADRAIYLQRGERADGVHHPPLSTSQRSQSRDTARAACCDVVCGCRRGSSIVVRSRIAAAQHRTVRSGRSTAAIPARRVTRRSTDINRGNVGSLQVAWTWKPGERALPEYGTQPGTFQNTPLMIDDVLYVSTPYNRVVALDARSGRELWRYDPEAVQGRTAAQRHRLRASRRRRVARRGGQLRIFMNSRYRLICLDARTGAAGARRSATRASSI